MTEPTSTPAIPPLRERLAVCSWSLHPENPLSLVAKVHLTGLHKVQLALDPLRKAPEAWAKGPALIRRQGIQIISGMFGTVGEDYSTLESIRATGGLVPDEHWEENWKNIQLTAALAQQLGLKLVTFHAGFVPTDESDPLFAKMVRRLGETADIFHTAGVTLGLETGQETAQSLAHLLKTINRPNLGVNFDPANMLLYDKGDPIEAIRLLAPWVRQVHIKDAKRTSTPGTWGREVAAGDGEVNWREFAAALKEMNFA